MTSHRPDPSPNGASLRGLNRITKGLTWLTGFFTLFSVVMYVGQQFLSDFYRPSLGTMVLTICAVLTTGIIVGLFFMALTKFTEIWAEVIDSGSHKTMLLEALLTNSGDDRAVRPEER